MLEACCLAWGIHIGTLHVGARQKTNDFNPGLYMRSGRWQAGAYWNSERRGSLYVAYHFPLSQRVSLSTGLVTGYARSTVSPAVVLTYSFDNGVRLVGIPPTPKTAGGLHLAYQLTEGEP